MGSTHVVKCLLGITLLCQITGSAYVSREVAADNAVDRSSQPFFDPSAPRNVTALVGKSAYLSCRVRQLGNKTVSWIRHRDLHILTVGGYTYTSDQRFQALFRQETQEWLLHIKWAQGRDAGVYECQVSTQPVASYFVTLSIVDPEQSDSHHHLEPTMRQLIRGEVPSASILGGPDLHVNRGSTINLTCTVRFSPQPSPAILWFHHDQVLSGDSVRGGVSVEATTGDPATSTLLIRDASQEDSGKYSCRPSNAHTASVFVHVLDGERPEAMQTNAAAKTTTSQLLALFFVIFDALSAMSSVYLTFES